MLHKLRHGVDLSIFCQAPLCGGARFVPVVLPVLLVFNAVLAGLGEWKKQTAKPNAETPWKFSEDLAFRFPHTAAILHFIIHTINYALPALPMLIQSQSVPVHSDTTRSEVLYKPSNPLPSSSQELRLPILSCSCLDSNLGTPGKQHETSRARSGCQNTDLPMKSSFPHMTVFPIKFTHCFIQHRKKIQVNKSWYNHKSKNPLSLAV